MIQIMEINFASNESEQTVGITYLATPTTEEIFQEEEQE